MEEVLNIIPVGTEQEKINKLNSMDVGDVHDFPREDQGKWSKVASSYFKFSGKLFKTSCKGRSDGRAVVWRVR